VVAKFTPVRDALDQILDDVGVAALNRLSPPAQYASPDDLRWLSDSDFQTIVDAHRDDVEAGRPDDGILLAALTQRIALRHERAGIPSDKAARGAAGEAKRSVQKLIKQVMKDLKTKGRAPPEARGNTARKMSLEPMVVLELMAILKRGWQEGSFDLWVRQPGVPDAIKIDPIDRGIDFFGDESGGEWVDPCMTEAGVKWFGNAIEQLLLAIEQDGIANAIPDSPAAPPAKDAVLTPATNLALREQFVAWMRTEKADCGRFPPRDPSQKSDRKGWSQWAVENNVRRNTVKAWVAEEGLSEPAHRPKKLGTENNLAAELPS
jgi:hypothetical protein